MKQEIHFAVVLYPKSSRPYIAVDGLGNPKLFTHRGAAKSHKDEITSVAHEPTPRQARIVRVTVNYELK